ncbi:MAG: helix-turn-helix domain-containing protein [Bdellovibrionales bacterium]|nr:helix-turn-helix domain-containing protein [Bdellovibrionales bacterium]
MAENRDKHTPLLLTVREAAQVLRIHRPKVYELIKAGEIDGFKLGSDWRIKRDSVERLTGPIPEEFFGETQTISSAENHQGDGEFDLSPNQ